MAVLAALLLGTVWIGAADPARVTAVSAPKVAIIVGPAGSQTAVNKDWANAAAREALKYTPNVVKVYSPYATWSRVKAGMTGASIVVYVGRGYGFPTPRTSVLKPSIHDGFALNPVSGVNNTTRKWYGEAYIRTVALAPRALVLLHHMDYASGKSPSGYPQPSLSVARRRVDNYGAGFLAAGASAVIAEATYPPTYYVRAIFTRNASLEAVWRGAPTYHGHVTSFTSSRTPGATGRTDPVRTGAGYYRSIVGWPATPTTTVRQDPARCLGTLQSRIDGTPAGGTLDLTGCTYSAGATITKALTLVGATVYVPANQRGFIVTSSNVTLDRLVIIGPQASTFRWNEVGVLVTKSVSNLTVRDSTIRRLGNTGIRGGPIKNPQILRNTVEDAVYAGILLKSTTGGRIEGNVVRRIGVRGAAANDNNAYGICLSDEPGIVSADTVITANTVEDVPTWHAFDIHGGNRIAFTKNTVRRSMRGIFITNDAYGNRPTDITVTGNYLGSPAPVSYNVVAVTTYRAVRVTVTGNTAVGWGNGSFFRDTGGLSTGLVVSGNNVTP